MSVQKHEFAKTFQTIFLVTSGTGLGWVLGLLSNKVLISVILGTILGMFVAFRLKGKVKRILTIILAVPSTVIILIALLVSITHFNNYLKLQKTRTYVINEAHLSFILAPKWQAKTHSEAGFLPYLFDLGGGYRNSPNKTVTLVTIEPPHSKERDKYNAGSIEILEGDAVSKASLVFEEIYKIKGTAFIVDGITGTKLVGYDNQEKLAIIEYLFYIPQSKVTARFYYSYKQNSKTFEAEFEKLVRSSNFKF